MISKLMFMNIAMYTRAKAQAQAIMKSQCMYV